MGRRWLRNVGGHPNEPGFRPGLIRTRMPPLAIGANRCSTLLSDQSTLHTTDLNIACPAGGHLTIHWGDGTSDDVVCDGSVDTHSHDYTETGQYTITVRGTVELITSMSGANQAWLGGDLGDTVAGLRDVAVLYFPGCGFSGDIADLARLVGLGNVYIANDLEFSDVPLPPWGGSALRFPSCGLSTAEVDALLIRLADGVGGAGTLNLGGSNAARTSASDAAVAALSAAGWSVTVNS